MPTASKFGTFGGVFTPSILTILGVIMYMRLPMIVGEAGLYATLGIVIVAHIISATTGLSVSSIATDKKVQAGGTYYMISRSLGLPIGGTLGIALFVGLSFSVSLYLIGFSESFLSYWGMEITRDSIRLAGTAVLLVVTIITLISTSLALKTQYFIMAAIILSLLSVVFGRHDLAPSASGAGSMSGALPLMVLFGIFFPAVTGFEAGVSMSGDLRDPKKSIPFGSLAAILVGFLVYCGLTAFLALTVNRELLATDPQVLLKIALVPELVIAGVWGATLSSALGSILGAPRILQATASDKITPSIFARGSGPTNEPRYALILTFVIAEAGILIGELDMIARIVSIFFIITYGFLNLSCAFESWTSADFRPAFRTPVWVSLLGTIACVIVMIQLDLLAMVGGILLLGGLFVLLKRKELRLESGDAWNGVWASLVKSGVDHLSKSSLHTRNWRPNIIMFRGAQDERSQLYELGSAMAGQLGMVSSFEIVPASGSTSRRMEQLSSGQPHLHAFRHHSTDVYTGMNDVVRLYGFSGVQPNTVLLGWSKKETLRKEFAEFVRSTIRADMNVVLLDYKSGKGFGSATTIDVWWGGRGSNLAFAITLLRHISKSAMWRTARIRLLLINNEGGRTEKVHRRLQRILEDYRISMEVSIINNSGAQLSAEEIIRRESGGTDLTFIGLPNAASPGLEARIEETHRLLASLGTTVVLHGCSQFEDLDAHLKGSHLPAETSLEELPLPPLPQAASPMLAADAEKISGNAERVLRLLYERTVALWISEERRLIKEFKGLCESVHEELDEMVGFTDSFRRKKALLRIQNDYLFRCRQIVGSINEETIAHQTTALRETVQWYVDRLDKDAERFPKTLLLEFPAEQLRIRSGDAAGERLVKLWQRALSAVTRRPARRRVPYRAIARQYLVIKRHGVLLGYLDQFRQDSVASLSRIRTAMLDLAEQLTALENPAITRDLTREAMSSSSRATLASVTALDRLSAQKGRLYQNRLLVEFRKNLLAMMDHLDHFDAAARMRRAFVPARVYKQAVNTNLQFYQRWSESISRAVDKTTLDIAIASLRSRVSDRMDEFEKLVVLQINSHLTNPMVQLAKSIVAPAKTDGGVKIEFEFEKSFELLDDLEEAHEDILANTRTLPERLYIAETDNGTDGGETVEVPAIRLTQHQIETQLISPVQHFMTQVTERLVKIGYTVKDHVNFARFGMENINPESDDREAKLAEILRTMGADVDDEFAAVAQVKNDISHVIHSAVKKTFDALAPHNVVRSASEFNDVLREYKKGQVLTSFGTIKGALQDFVRRRIVRVLYRRHAGRVRGRQSVASPRGFDASDIRDVLDRVSPRPDVIKALPQFYINLFSGRSSIGAEFWIARAREEEAFATAVRRFRSGVQGAILVLGGRNAGKTTFCRYVCTRHFKQGSALHLFPPREGSVDPSVFASTLAKASGMSGDPSEILGSLPRNSVVCIHDLELWFERHTGGLEALQAIRSLIEQYASEVVFVLNTTVSAYELMRAVEPLEDVVAETITLSPMGTEDLERMVTLRHHSSGMTYRLGKKEEDHLSDFTRARFFDAHFRISQGNPGVALVQWLVHIDRVQGKQLHIHMPAMPSTGVLNQLPDDWLVYLSQYALHKRMGAAKLSRVTGRDLGDMERVVRHMHSAGLLEERSPGLFMINTHLDHLVRSLLRERQLL